MHFACVYILLEQCSGMQLRPHVSVFCLSALIQLLFSLSLFLFVSAIVIVVIIIIIILTICVKLWLTDEVSRNEHCSGGSFDEAWHRKITDAV